MSRRERLDELYQRLAIAPAPNSAEAAWELILLTLEQVEDEMSGIPKADPPPPPGFDDGRMYPPQKDFVDRTEDGGIMARTRRHRILISPNGHLEFWSLETADLEFEK